MNNKINTIDTIIFDFGGTLDTDGIHWCHKFFEHYVNNGIMISKSNFVDAYIFGERNVAELMNPDDSFFTTLNYKIGLQLRYLFSKEVISEDMLTKQKAIVYSCYNDVIETIKNSVSILKGLQEKFKLAVASNYYGNLETVFNELNINNFFSYIYDSAKEGIRKPDAQVFEITLGKLNSLSRNSVVIGDSYSKDIDPAKSIGCTTIWIVKKPWSRPESTSSADYIISSLNELRELSLFI